MDAKTPHEAYRHIPHDIDIEQSLLGSVLRDNQVTERASALIKAEHFCDPLHGRIFATMLQMVQRDGVLVTPLTLHAIMKSDPGVIEVGGQDYFNALYSAAPVNPNIKDMAGILTDLAVRRKLITLGQDIINAAYDPPTEKTSEVQIEEAENALHILADEAWECSGNTLPFINVSAWEGTVPPEREWAVRDRLPARCATLLSGEGSVGKTLISEQLAVATVLEKDWFGVIPRRGPALVVCCEDDVDEMHRRFAKIADHYGSTFSRLRDLHAISLAGKDATFAAPDRYGIIQPTALFRRVFRAAKDIKPSIVILDNSADIFAGNENDRSQVRRFISLLTQIAMEADSAVLLTSHPSLTGINSGTGISGSTAWHASVRARMYMRKPKAEGDTESDPDERVLEVMKSNYGPPGESISLRWQNGLFVPTSGMHWIDKRAAVIAAEDLFLRLLARFDKQGRNTSDKPNAPTYAPAQFAKDPEALSQGIRKPVLVAAMNNLFATNKIHVESYGRPSRRYQKVAVGPHP